MKILGLKASGNMSGSSAILADEFIRGAEENGHEMTEYKLTTKKIEPCLGCNHCGMNGPCARKDDFENELKGLLRATDLIVFAMPVYYYNWPAQLKVVVDRFYSFTTELTNMHKKTVLLAVAWDNTDAVFKVTKAYYYETLCDYMEFTDCGMVLGKGCGTPGMTRATEYPQAAYKLGKSI